MLGSRYSLAVTLALGLVMPWTAFAGKVAANEIVDVSVNHVFAPTGFDDNDQAQVVVDGMFPNSCYQIAPSSFTIDQENWAIKVYPKAEVRDAVCMQVLVPFSQVIDLGVLPKGDWTIQTGDSEHTKALNIKEANNAGPDDELYAAIDNAFVTYDHEVGSDVVILEGRYTNSCMTWKKSQVIHEAPDVIEILPIVRIDLVEDCEDIEYAFKNVKVPLPNTLTSGRYLLHIRSMHGRAVNRVFSVNPEFR